MARLHLKKHPLIVLQPTSRNEPFWRAFVMAAKDMNWRLLDLNMTNFTIPDGLKPDGAVLRDFADSPLSDQLNNMGCKCLRVGMFMHPMDHQLPAIVPDTETAGRMAANHFAMRAFKHVGYVRNTPHAQRDLTFKGFSEKAEELGITLHVLEKGLKTKIDTLLSGWLKSLPKPIGLFAYNQYLANKMIMFSHLEGLLVPQEVAVLSSVNSLTCEMSLIPISAINTNQTAQGQDAALLLQQLMTDQAIPSCTLFSPERVVVRQSTDVMAVPDVTVSKAVSFMWEHLDWPIAVDDVAMEVNVSRSTLERKFSKHLGRGVKAELQRKRLERCGELLRGTDLTLAEIADLTGFGSRIYLHNTFVKQYGATPGHYRNENSKGEQPLDKNSTE